MTQTVPYVCRKCLAEGSYNGSLRHKETDPIPVCRHHGEKPEEMQPVNREKK